jgi:orsellinic acid C2-O-methyltransferase
VVDTVNTAPIAAEHSATGPGAQLIRTVIAVADRLSLRPSLAGGPRGLADLARATGTDAPALRRLLRALACVGYVDEVAPGLFAAASQVSAGGTGNTGGTGNADRTGNADDAGTAGGAMQPLGALLGEGGLLYAVRTGEPAARALLGRPVFDFIAADPDASSALAAFTASATSREAPAIVAAGQFGRFGHVIDVGGGTGMLIKHILASSRATHGTVLDTAASAPTAIRELASAPDLQGRWTVLPGDFFDGVPAGGDCYLLKSVLHDWDDPTCVRILRNCAAAMATTAPAAPTATAAPTARLVIVEPVLPEFAAWSPAHLPAVLSDVVCMVMSDGGRERTQTEYRDLLAASGFALLAAAPVDGSAHFHLLEAELVPARPPAGEGDQWRAAQ